ncbi:MAG TPA: hypothetical protein VFH96_05500 [Pyrinomonadaceae bacterium]|nr:hypothetical protein [Pyrinomonadaceae bacterium]
MESIQVFDRPVSQAFYSVAGRLLFIESSSLELRNLIVDLFAGWQLTPVSLPDRSPDIQISFSCEDLSQRIPRDLDQFEIADGGKCYTDGTGLYLEFGGPVVHLENGDLVSVSFTELPRLGDPLFGRAASFAVCAALRRFGLFDLHSAGVVEPQSGKAVLIIGPSGSGKSTLALQLVQSGWSYLSDDELLLSLNDGAVEARGFRSFFAISEAGTQFKRCFEPLGLKRVELAYPGFLLFISLNGESRSQLGKLTPAETMTRLITACPWATYDRSVAGANLELLSTLARQSRGFDLSAGRDLLEPGFAASFFSAALCVSLRSLR